MTTVLQRHGGAAGRAFAAAAASDTDPDAAETARLAGLMPPDETQLLYSLCLHGRGELGWRPTSTPR
jgi:DNA polymerase-3 subunit gamma/tau